LVDLLALRLQETLSYHAGMLFGPPYIGKAIAILREPLFTQKELAAALGIENGTMNKYERGKQQVPEGTLRKIAGLIHREVIEIFDAAYDIFRYNHFLDEARRTGREVEEIIARHDSRVTIEEVHAARASYLERLDEWERQKTELAAQQKIQGHTVLRHVVEPEKKAVRKPKR
jgi:transcriptional regulator with XRE-family HTH domain